MKNNFLEDIKTATNLFIDMRKASKEGKKITVNRTLEIPMFSVGNSFFDTIEGCTLSNCKESGVCVIAQKAFSELPYDIKCLLSNSPKDGEFVERANFWKRLLQPVMTSKQYHVAMTEILNWYIHIKKQRGGYIWNTV